MPEHKHTEDLRNVNEGDSVTIKTTNGKHFAEVTCTDRISRTADQRTGEVRETTTWIFPIGDNELTVSIIDGLRSSPNDPDFPSHKEANIGNVGDYNSWKRVGYFESVEIHGPILES